MSTLESRVNVSRPQALAEIFSAPNVLRTLKRIRKDDDTLVAHPLRRVILLEYAEQFSQVIARLIPSGRWTPTTAYVCLVRKRSGAYRELVFPALIDSIIGRCLIDALEPYITADDNDRTYCGRQHANTNREPGDYERWFSVWQDYTAAIAKAAKASNFAYVFDTDVADFFPSIDRERAKLFLAARTGAHRSILDLLFLCLESWLPRFEYSRMTGIPIENNDISRLVAHSYLKEVDAAFNDGPDQRYLRYVDDTVVFVEDEPAAENARRRHHLALRQVGLNPNAAKSAIVKVEDFEAERHREVNLSIQHARRFKRWSRFDQIVEEWYGRDRTTTPNWDRVARHLYRVARDFRRDVLREHAIKDMAVPALMDHALDYLQRFLVTTAELEALLKLARRRAIEPEPQILIARFVGDARFEEDVSDTIATAAVKRVTAEDARHGAGYAKGLWLLALHKHGERQHRERIVEWATLPHLEDEQFRLHYMYVMFSCGQLDAETTDKLRHLSTPDLELTMRLVEAARDGRFANHREILQRMRAAGTIPARHLPLLRVMLATDAHRTLNVRWLKEMIETFGGMRTESVDKVALRFLKTWLVKLTE